MDGGGGGGNKSRWGVVSSSISLIWQPQPRHVKTIYRFALPSSSRSSSFYLHLDSQSSSPIYHGFHAAEAASVIVLLHLLRYLTLSVSATSRADTVSWLCSCSSSVLLIILLMVHGTTSIAAIHHRNRAELCLLLRWCWWEAVGPLLSIIIRSIDNHERIKYIIVFSLLVQLIPSSLLLLLMCTIHSHVSHFVIMSIVLLADRNCVLSILIDRPIDLYILQGKVFISIRSSLSLENGMQRNLATVSEVCNNRRGLVIPFVVWLTYYIAILLHCAEDRVLCKGCSNRPWMTGVIVGLSVQYPNFSGQRTQHQSPQTLPLLFNFPFGVFVLQI